MPSPAAKKRSTPSKPRAAEPDASVTQESPTPQEVAHEAAEEAKQSQTEPDEDHDPPVPKKNPPSYRKFDWSVVGPDFLFTVTKHVSEHEPLKKSGRGKKRKRESNVDQQQLSHQWHKNPFNDDFSTWFSVSPADYWEDCSKYRRFTIQNETFEVGNFIFVRGDDPPGSPHPPLIRDWVARVAEVRAADEQHVFVRVNWLYRPEDLPSGRLPHHGRNELIACDVMDIIDALSVQGRATVEPFDENSDSGQLLDPDALFWRQTLATLKARLSPLRTHCRDQKPFNPDSVLIKCDAPECGGWLHAACLERDAVERACAKHDIPAPPPPPPTTSSASAGSSPSPSKKHASKKGGKRASLAAAAKKDASAATPPPFTAELIGPDGKPLTVLKGVPGASGGPGSDDGASDADDGASAVDASTIAVVPNNAGPGGAPTAGDGEDGKKDGKKEERKDAKRDGGPRVRVKDLREEGGEGWVEEVKCLLCGRVVD